MTPVPHFLQAPEPATEATAYLGDSDVIFAVTAAFPCPVDHRLGWFASFEPPTCNATRLRYAATDVLFHRGRPFEVVAWQLAIGYDCGAERHDPEGVVHVYGNGRRLGDVPASTWVFRRHPDPVLQMYVPGVLDLDGAPLDLTIGHYAVALPVTTVVDRLTRREPAPGDWLDRPEILDRPARTSLESGEPIDDDRDLSPGLTAEEILEDVDRVLARIEEEDRARHNPDR